MLCTSVCGACRHDERTRDSTGLRFESRYWFSVEVGSRVLKLQFVAYILSADRPTHPPDLGLYGRVGELVTRTGLGCALIVTRDSKAALSRLPV